MTTDHWYVYKCTDTTVWGFILKFNKCSKLSSDFCRLINLIWRRLTTFRVPQIWYKTEPSTRNGSTLSTMTASIKLGPKHKNKDYHWKWLVSGPVLRVIHQSIAKHHHFENCDFIRSCIADELNGKLCPFTIQNLIKITILKMMALHGTLVCDSEN